MALKWLSAAVGRLYGPPLLISFFPGCASALLLAQSLGCSSAIVAALGRFLMAVT